jgi:GH15 family glucan-1,4-alpha-glucosidase
MNGYPPIEDHGLIGDLQTAALVTKDGSIDWFCCPRFDSPSIFASLLDNRRGGRFQLAPATDSYTSRQLYFPDTAVLITRFMTEDGVGEVVDFMPVSQSHVPTDRHRLFRLVRCVRGAMTFRLDVAPRFDYGRLTHTTDLTENGAVMRADGVSLTLHVVRDAGDEHLTQLALRDGGDLHGQLTLRAGEMR